MANQLPKVEETQPATEVTETPGVTRFGIGQINKPTPMWVTWVFRTEFVLNKCVGIWIASQTTLDLPAVKNLILWTTLIDAFVWGIGKFVGITKDELEK